MITDRFDGALARSYDLVTEFGKLADPIADKALIGAALIGLSLLGDLPWWVTILILIREIGVTILRFAVIRRGVIPASRGGKLKTLVQAMAIGLFVLPLSGAWLTGAWIFMWAAIVLTVVTGLDYVVSAFRDGRRAGRHAVGAGNHWRACGRSALSDRRTKESTMTALLREVIGDVLRHARTEQGRTLREVSDDARVSLGYLSEVERGRKEASSELLSAICGALDVPLSRVLTDAGEEWPATSGSPRSRSAASTANIDVTTKVVIPHVVTMAVA